jgi:hypothetical protein
MGASDPEMRLAAVLRIGGDGRLCSAGRVGPLAYGASMTELSQAALGRATLARQMLLAPAERDPIEAIAHLVGLQAQAQFPPYYGLWCRLREFAPERLAELIVDRSVVRVALMRSAASR